MRWDKFGLCRVDLQQRLHFRRPRQLDGCKFIEQELTIPSAEGGMVRLGQPDVRLARKS